MTEDHGLRGRFTSLRQHIEGRAPSFDAILGRAAVRHPVRTGAWRVVGAAMLAIFAVTLPPWFSRGPGPEISIPAALMLRWKSPTDFLLDTPEQAFLRSVPRIGELPSPLPAVDGESPPITQQPSSLPENAS